MRIQVMAKASRNPALDVIRTLAAFAVVYIHCGSTSGYVGFVLNALSRFAVPFFFMVSGYFMVAKITPNRVDNKSSLGGVFLYVQRIVMLTIISTLIYWSWFFFQYWHEGSVADFIFAFNKIGIFMWIAHNDVPHGPHLWYFYALLYSLVILLAMVKYRCVPWIMLAVAVALLCYDLYCEYSGVNYVRDYHLGVPCLIFGYLTNVYKSNIKKLSIHLSLMACVLFILYVCEGCFRYYTFNHTTINLYVLSVPFAFVLLLWGQYTKYEFKNKAIYLLKYVGQYLSTLIFILHPLVSFICKELYNAENSIAYWLFICLLTCLFSYLYLCVKNHIFLNCQHESL